MATLPQQSSAAPPIPPRHPGRLSKMSCTYIPAHELLPPPVPTISRRQTHRWEHASLLFHGYDWHAAAESFLSLSRSIKIPLESNLTLLNAALIYARLDDFEAAAQLLLEAEPQQQTSAFTMFLLGHVEFEQGSFEKAEECFKLALSQLQGEPQNLEKFGIDYILRPLHIKETLRILETKNNVLGVLGTLGALPANLIFEAPSTLTGRLRRRSNERDFFLSKRRRASVGSDGVPTLTDMSLSSGSASPVDNYLEDLQDNPWSHVDPEAEDHGVSIRESGLPLTVESIDDGLSRAPHPPFSRGPLPANTYQLPEMNDCKAAKRVVERPNSQERPSSQKSQSSRLPKRRSNLVPRDARVQDDTVGALSQFIRKLPAQNAREPRNAEAKSESVWDMARFFQDGPEVQARDPYSAEDSSSAPYKDEEVSHSTARKDRLTDEDLLQMAESLDKPTPRPNYRHRSGVGEIPMRSGSYRGNGNDEVHSTSRTASFTSKYSVPWSVRSVRSESSAPPDIPLRNSSLRTTKTPPPSTPIVTRLDEDTPKRPASTRAPSSYAQFFPKRWEERLRKW